MSGFEDLTDRFKQRLRSAARDDLITLFDATISGYDQEIDRQQKLLAVLFNPGDVQRLSVSKQEVPPEELKWSPSQFQNLTDVFKRRLLTAAREDLIGDFETTISRYEKEIDRQRKLLDVVLKPEIKLRRADVQQLSVIKEEVPPEQRQEWRPSLDQEDPEPPHIKEEQEEVRTSQQGEQLQGFTFAAVPVKSEDDDDDDEEKPQSSQLHQRQTKQMETDDGEDCGGPEPEPGRNSDPDTHLTPDTVNKASDFSEPEPEPETDDCDKDWKDPDRKSFHCSVCGKAFKHRGNLNIHMRTHTGEKPFSCSLCSKRFTQKSGLDYHLKTHTGERPFSCSICGKTYRHKGALTYHMATHTGVKPFSCKVCGKRFRGTSQLKIHRCVGESAQPHRSQRGKRKKPLSCSECNATFPNNYVLMTHIRMHKGKKLFTCTICGKKRHFSSHLEIHMRTHTGEKPYSCSVCGKRFSQRGIMTQHMAVHSGVKPFSCSDCGRRFFWQFQIKKHKCLGKSSWQRQTGFNGKDCGASERVRNLNPDRHLSPGAEKEIKLSFETDDSVDMEFWKETRKHQSGFTYRRNKKKPVNDGCNPGKKPFSCSDDMAKVELKTNDRINIDFCRQIRQLQTGPNHLKNEGVSISDPSFNTDKKPFSSFTCDRRSEDGHTLQRHKKCHTGEKKFSCLFCEKEFVTGGHLTRHISVHIGEKILSCIVCEKAFTLESELISHECVHQSQSVEQMTANKSFSCSQCGKEFGRKHHLQVHMRSHAGEKQFSCSVCGKTFAKRENLSFHMTCHTGEKPLHCSVCNTGFIDSESLIKHMRIHTRQTQFSCSICGKEFAWRRYLTKHMEVHAKQKIYSCSVCDRGFAHIYQLNYHQCAGRQSFEINRESEPLAGSSRGQMDTDDGEDCGGLEPAQTSDPDTHLTPDTYDKDSYESETEVSDDDWKEGGEVSHNDTTCNTAKSGETLYNNPLLKIRLRNHTGEKSFSCLICEENFTERGSLSEHMAVHRGVKQEDPEPPHIKEEQEEVGISQEGEQLQGFTFTPVPVKSEDDDDDEEKPPSSQLHQRQTEQMETEADGDTDNSVDSDFWKETRERPSGLNSLNNDEISESVTGCDPGNQVLSCSDDKASESLEPESDNSTDSDFWKDDRKPQESSRKPHGCSECGRRFRHVHHLKIHMKFHAGKRATFFCSVCGLECLYKSHLKIHMRTHTGEKPFGCPVCGKKYAHKASMQSHMVIHTVEKQYTCNACDKGFAWYTELKYHQCVGEASNETP